MFIRFIVKIIKEAKREALLPIQKIVTAFTFYANGVKFYWDFTSRGIPIINVNLKGNIGIGKKFVMNSGKYNNMIGRQQQCYFIVGKYAYLTIGDNVAMSATAIVCQKKIVIGNNVRIGGGTVIYDTDFHNIDYSKRVNTPEDYSTVIRRPIVIEDNVFIGAHSIILKGVTIGKNSIIGAGSVVSKFVPENQIWAGNPARYIKTL